MAKDDTERYIAKLTSRTKPKAVVVCMIYFPDEETTGSWADCALSCLGYGCCPWKVQSAIERMFISGTSKISIPGTKIIPLPLFKSLDGKLTEDYVQRVEPSASGSAKIAADILEAMSGV